MGAIVESYSGMDLRDYFAAHLVAHAPFNSYQFAEKAQWAYAQADAMMEARKQDNK